MSEEMTEETSAQSNSPLLRFARWQAQTLVRVWPEESRRWGQALASEAEEIDQPLEAVSWALGGVTVYLRAIVSHLLSWLSLPVGTRSKGSLGPLLDAPGPKRSRLFAAVALVGAVGLLSIPEGREAVRTLRATWNGFEQTATDRATLEKIAARAEKENDARTMAFVALSLRDEKSKEQLSERAVALDSQLFWIYAAQRYARAYGSQPSPAKPAWIAKVQAADPDNAVPYLLAADEIADRELPGVYQRHPSTVKEIAYGLAKNPEWVALMHRAFRAPRYNSYFREHEELSRVAWNRERELSFSAAFMGLWAHSIPNLLYLKTFTGYLIGQAQDERAVGHLDRAEALLQEADRFSDRLERSNSGLIEELVALGLQKNVALEWKSFYEATQRSANAQAATQRAAQIDQRLHDVRGQRGFEDQSWRGQDAWVVQISAVLMVIATLAAILCIAVMELRPIAWKSKPITRRVLCRTTDFAPAVVLSACGVFLVSFLPYAQVLAAFRTGYFREEQVSRAMWSLTAVTNGIAGSEAAVVRWTALTVVLSLLAALLLARMMYRAWKTTAAQP